MKKTLCLILAVFAALMAVAGTEQPAVAEKMDRYLSASVANGFSGAMLVAQKGQIILKKGYGLADRERQLPNSADTVYSIGSVTKQFTAAAVLQLTTTKKFKVEDTLDQFFDELPKDKAKITVHQLLTHSSGLVDRVGEGDFDPIPREVYFKRLFETELMHEPGSKYVYSNAGYSVLARIVELVSGEAYERYVRERLFLPAGMQHTGYLLPNWDEKPLAVGYRFGVQESGTLIERFREMGEISWVLKGNGGIHATLEDMFKWYQALKNHTVLSASLVEKLTTGYVPEGPDGGSYYAYGWAIFKTKRGTKLVTHNGSNMVYFHDFLWMPQEDVVIIFACNAYSEQVENMAWRMERMLFEPNYEGEPVQKNIYLTVAEYMENHQAREVSGLEKLIRKTYNGRFGDPGVLNRLGYEALKEPKQVSWAVALFEINTHFFPKDANLWDSLGDGYKTLGLRNKAVRAYQEALRLNPMLTVSRNSLTELGVTPPEKKKIAVDAALLKAYVGRYQLQPGKELSITTKDGKLFAQPTGREVVPATALSQKRFLLEPLGVQIEFNPAENGAVDQLTLYEGGEGIPVKRVK